jgi:exonuclease SbcD
VKLLHTADIHLGAKNYGRMDAASGLNTRLLDMQRSFDVMVERALDEEIDCFLFCGDAYHTADPTPTQQKIFARCLQPIADAGIPIVLVIGNHDHPVSHGKASSLDIFPFLDGDIHLFTRPSLKTISTKSGPLQLLALPWPIRSLILTKEEHRSKTPDEVRAFIEQKYVEYVQTAAQTIKDEKNGFSPDVPTVLAGHLTVQGAELAGSERTSLIAREPKFTVGQLAVPPVHYVALGHIHQPQNRNPEGDIPVMYAGSIERVSFKERGERKGFYLVDLDPAHAPAAAPTYVETPARPFVAIDVDARDAEAPTEHILDAIARHDLTDAVVRVRHRIDEEQVPLVDTHRLRDALQDANVIASIERTVDPAERQRRTVVTRESDLEDAIRQYVGQHDELEGLEDDMVDAALELEAAYEAERREN